MNIQGTLFQGEGFRRWGNGRGQSRACRIHVGIRVWEGGVTSETGPFHKWNKPIKGIVQLSWRAQDRERRKGYKCREEVLTPLQIEAWGEAGSF